LSRQTNTTTTPRRILVHVDFSPPFRKAAAAAVELAKHLDARLALVHVTVPKGRSGSYAALKVMGMTIDPHRPACEKLAEFARRHLPADLAVETRVLIGPREQTTSDTTRKLDAGLVVLSRHGHTWFKHLLVASVAERVAQHALCDGLVVRQPGGLALSREGKGKRK